jgi:hypothetical protein
MTPEKITRRDWAFIIIGILAIVAISYPYWSPYIITPPTVPLKYTTGLTVKFKVYDVAGTTLLETAILPEFYAVGDNPFARTFTKTALAVAAFDSNGKFWSVPLDAGTYTLLIKDTTSPTKTKYPVKATVTVTGTNSEDKEVWLTPSIINMDTRATSTIATPAIKAFNATSGAYDITVSTINYTRYDKWRISYEITISDTNKKVEGGRYYWTKISGLIITQGYLDGSEVSILEDTEAADDGQVGYYITFSDYKAGELHRIDIYVEDVGASAGTFKLTQFEYYECVRSGTTLRWWTDAYKNITVQA